MDREVLLVCLYVSGLNGKVNFNCGRESYVEGEG